MIILLIISAVMLAPVIMTIAGSLKAPSGYADFFLWQPRYLRALLNSLFIASAGAAGCTVVSAGAAYVFAKVSFPFRGLLFYLYIIVMMMPFQVTMLPQYITARNYRIYDTPFALILPGIFSAFGVFLLTQIVKTVPDDTIEAARLETDSTFLILARVILPQVGAGMICLFALMFTEIWNMTAEPLTLMETKSIMPLAALTAWDKSAAGAASVVIALIPPVLLYSLFGDEIERGIEHYNIKG